MSKFCFSTTKNFKFSFDFVRSMLRMKNNERKKKEYQKKN